MKSFQRIVLIDNLDSFTFNLVDYFKQQGAEVSVYRNTVDIRLLQKLNFDLLVLSPGPGVPRDAGNLMDIIEAFYDSKPIFGVCLGFQALVEFFGGSLRYLDPVHGKSAIINHDGKTIYKGLPRSIEVGRYHSLAADLVPQDLEISSSTQDGIPMSFRHKQLPIEGVQYHPESVLSMRDKAGFRMIENLISGRISTGDSAYKTLIRTLQDDAHLSASTFNDFLDALENELLNEEQKLILLVSLSYRLKTPYALKSFIEVILSRSPIKVEERVDAIDICGTGGSGLPRLNTSTLSALLLSSKGQCIVKHGNKAASGRFGSFDLLESLGLDLKMDLNQQIAALEESHLAFLYAPTIHPVMGSMAQSRTTMGVPTIFNLMGPLLNPFQPECQLIGTAFENYMELLFETAILLGKKHVVVLRSADGLDEISVSGPTDVLEYKDGQRLSYTLNPGDFGLEPIPLQDVLMPKGGAKAEAERFLAGENHHPSHELVLVNAAFAYSKFHKHLPLHEAYQIMRVAYQNGEALSHFNQYLEIIGSTSKMKDYARIG